MRRLPVAVLIVLALAAGLGIGVVGGSLVMSQVATSAATPSGAAVAGSPTPATSGSAPSIASASPSAEASPTASPAPTEPPTPTPAPTPVLVPDPLDGVPVSPALARRRVIAVMIDDLWAARPQSGLSAASIVWQAPAEGGIPRYMALFSEGSPPQVGPIRSSRLYYIAWAAEWNAVYAHVGGSPQALALLNSSQGRGKVVWNADEFRWSKYLYRVKFRYAPHNVYSDDRSLRRLVKAVGAPTAVDYKAAWQFAPDVALEARPDTGAITVPYLANKISYKYDRASNTYLRSVSVEGKQVDAGTKQRIAPKNVVVIYMSFAPLNDGHPQKHRLEAQYTGSGKALVFTNGTLVKATWKKDRMTTPTYLYGADGQPVTLTAGQTFVQVVPIGTKVTYKLGTVPDASAAPSPSPSG